MCIKRLRPHSSSSCKQCTTIVRTSQWNISRCCIETPCLPSSRLFLSFCAQLSGLYLLHKEEIEAAIRQKSCFTLVHLESLLKVIVTLTGMLTMGQQVFHRVRKIALVEGEHSVSVLSPEQMILLLLEAFKRSNERADDLCYDLLGMVKVQGTDLDMPFLPQQAAHLGVTELLARALVDAGLRDA